MTSVRYATFPRTEPPPHFAEEIVQVFATHEHAISTTELAKGLESNDVLAILRADLQDLGFDIETGKRKDQKISRPVFYGEGGMPTVRYEIDGYHPQWRCGIEVEAGRAWAGNAVYRDLIQAMVMVDIDHLCLAVPNAYKHKSGGRDMVGKDYENAYRLVDALFGHSRVKFPYRLVLIGY